MTQPPAAPTPAVAPPARADGNATGGDPLAPFFRPATTLRTVGPAKAARLDKLLGRPAGSPARVVDLLFHLPTGAIDRSRVTTILDAPHREAVTLDIVVESHHPAQRPRAPYRVHATDATGAIDILFFNAKPDFVANRLPVGARRHVSGRLEWHDGRARMIHPDRIVTADAFAAADPIEATYPMTEGLHPNALRVAIAAAADRIAPLPEWLDPAFLAREGFPAFADALAAVHRPATLADATPTALARRRLAYDEMLASQLALVLIRERMRRRTGRARPPQPAAIERLSASLPFRPTKGQETAVAEIAADLASDKRMVRLLQGDVGAGKTLVAAFAAGVIAAGGAQTAVMAPTELLARQHHDTLTRLLTPVGIDVRLLTGRQSQREADAARAAIADGLADVVVGTQALFQAGVAFPSLALVVVDEQHRFGVAQRLALTEKGEAADLLVMTATPIPRTLVLSQLGDMDVSRLTEKPAGRAPIETRAVSAGQLPAVVERLEAAVGRGEKAYWICPLVEESAILDVAAATDRHAELAAALSVPVGLVHGKMPIAERERVMDTFRAGETRVLVATTVVEVGVDVPDATIMVIEHAERFGLSQLHQLRGRVGRGERPSTCLLLYRPPLGATARARLEIMRRTNDGFLIAEEDLRLRGEGEILGTRQSGAPGFRLADPEVHAGLLETARDDARLQVARDADLASARGQALRVLLRLFERREAIRVLSAG